MDEKGKNIVKQAIFNFGAEAQTEKAIEEMGELIVELSRRHSPRYSQARIAEEIADAMIMLEQLQIIYGEDYVDGFVCAKLERLEKRLSQSCLDCKYIRPRVVDSFSEATCALCGRQIGKSTALTCSLFEQKSDSAEGKNE